MDSTPQTADPRLQQVLDFPVVNGISGRRSRRFGFGMSIPGGPLAYTYTMNHFRSVTSNWRFL